MILFREIYTLLYGKLLRFFINKGGIHYGIINNLFGITDNSSYSVIYRHFTVDTSCYRSSDIYNDCEVYILKKAQKGGQVK